MYVEPSIVGHWIKLIIDALVAIVVFDIALRQTSGLHLAFN